MVQASLKAYSSGDVGINTLMVWHAEQNPRGSSLCAKSSFCLSSFLDPNDLSHADHLNTGKTVVTLPTPAGEVIPGAIHNKSTMHGKCSVATPYAKGCSGATAPLKCMPPPACPLEERES